MKRRGRGGESYSYGAVGGLVVLNEMRSRGAEGKTKVERERESERAREGSVTLQSEKHR